ncbi:hypothetical protein [Suttonella ornithocola]|uniref:Uncharacterized protein n=1 Tax=Suttonella ornithocola TaxID=279832 RepID=A0A380MYS3_9GAMM|nr:hypothetical protein [Suttonella ornithocola]SUO97176.1 Uncharacterised protein [Suttonella ornithocola]
MSIKRQTISQADLLHYQQLLDSGKVKEFYLNLEEKGYRSATWAKTEFDMTTRYGIENTIFLQKQLGRELNKTEINQLEQNLATQILNQFSQKVKDSDINGSQDLSYEEASLVRQRSYERSKIINAQWIFDSPIKTYKQLHGDAQGEQWYEKLRDGSHKSFKANYENTKKILEKYDHLIKNDPNLNKIDPAFIAALATVAEENRKENTALDDLKNFIQEVAGSNINTNSVEQAEKLVEIVKQTNYPNDL